MMIELVEMILAFLIMIILLVLLEGFFKANRVELKRAKWIPYPKRRPKKNQGESFGYNAVRLLVSREDGTVCVDTYSFTEDSFSYDDVDAWRPIPMSYKNNRKIVRKIIDSFRKKDR